MPTPREAGLPGLRGEPFWRTTGHSAPRQFRRSNNHVPPVGVHVMLRSALAITLACAAASLAAPPAAAAPARSSTTQIDYATFRALAVETEGYRQTRLVDWNQFLAA